MRGWIAAMLLVCGYFYFTHQEADVTYLQHVVRAGETLNGIAYDYHNLNTKDYIPADDYAMEVRMKNNHLVLNNRQLQIGDVVLVPVFTVKK